MLQLTCERDKKFAALAQTTDLCPQRFKFPKGKQVRQIAVWVAAPCVCRRETHRQQRRERRDCEDTHADFKMERVHTIWVNNIKYLDCFFSAWAGGPLGWGGGVCANVTVGYVRHRSASRLMSPVRSAAAISTSWWCCYWLTKNNFCHCLKRLNIINLVRNGKHSLCKPTATTTPCYFIFFWVVDFLF